MQCVARRRRLAFSQPEPALLVDVPGNIEGLQPATRQGDQILLKWVDAKRVFDGEDGALAVRAFSFHQITVGLLQKARPGPRALVFIRKAPEHAVFCRQLHRTGMVRIKVSLRLFLVTALTTLFRHVAGKRDNTWVCRCASDDGR